MANKNIAQWPIIPTTGKYWTKPNTPIQYCSNPTHDKCKDDNPYGDDW